MPSKTSKRSHKNKSYRKGGSATTAPTTTPVPKIHGGDASDHAISVYGNMGQQHAVGNGSNMIAENGGAVASTSNINGVSPASVPATPSVTSAGSQMGGKRRGKKSNLLIPSFMLNTNQFRRFSLKTKKRRSTKSRKNKK